MTVTFARKLLAIDRARRRLTKKRPVTFVQWYVVLELFLAAKDDLPVIVTNLTHDAGVPRSTALKTITDLATSGIVERRHDKIDRRRIFLTLAPDSRRKLVLFLQMTMEEIEPRD